jgi:hypothetical protein
MLDTSPTKKEFLLKIKEYCDRQDKQNLPYTLPGLSEHIGCYLSDILEYPSGEKYSELIELAKLKCHNSIVNAMLTSKIDKTTGQMILKNHFGYTDKIDIKKDVKVNISKVLDEIESSS